ncbi:precorrin-4 C(11)-methyltransferase, partial [Candidatus Bipolaricaulota bacterium]|nr:precorrin-4 C(11)-methyltransferase [Candidatus Bipolaricaulota bacterium]
MPVYFIGAGAGDPELMTVKGKNILGKADTVIYAGSLVNPDVLDYAPETAETFNSAELNLDEIMEKALPPARDGKVVARVHTGDPSIYGSLQEQIEFLEGRGVDYEVVPGVSSLVAAAAAVGREYTLPEVSQSVIVTRLEGRTPVPEGESLGELAVHRTSMAIFLSVHMIDRVVDELKSGYEDETPVAVVKKASWPEEKVVKGKLENI